MRIPTTLLSPSNHTLFTLKFTITIHMFMSAEVVDDILFFSTIFQEVCERLWQ